MSSTLVSSSVPPCESLRSFTHLFVGFSRRFDALTSSYYRGAGACAIVFSTTDRASFEAVDKWREKLRAQVGDEVVVALVQNKIDLAPTDAKMTEEEVNAVAARWQVPLFRTSVKDNVNIDALFSHLASQYILRGGDTSGTTAMPAMGTLGTHGGAMAAPANASGTTDDSGSIASSPSGLQSPSQSSGSAMGSPSGAVGSASSPRGGANGGPITIRSDSASSPSSAGGRKGPVEETIIETHEAAPAAAPAPDASATAASNSSNAAASGALPMPPTSGGAFKLTAEPKLKKKKKGIFSC